MGLLLWLRHCHHFLGGVMVIDPQTKIPQALAFVAVDIKDCRIVNNWDVIGMRGTGSQRIVIENLTIPGFRLCEFTDMKFRPVGQPGRSLHPNPMYHGGVLSFLGLELACVAVGAAWGAFDICDEMLRVKKSPLGPPPYRTLSELHEYQQRMGHAQSLIDTAEFALLAVATKYVEAAHGQTEQNASPDGMTVRRLIAVTQHCSELAWQAMEILFRTGGTSSTGRGSALARCFRNMAVMRTHPLAQLDRSAVVAGRAHFGLPTESPEF
jgi:3-hydroxy-9,10-secoandrosta-1,3,5(10)-triene-9,17-dione monooxygenase